MELVANWRAQPPVQMEIGRVLHPDDVMAGKMDANYATTIRLVSIYIIAGQAATV